RPPGGARLGADLPAGAPRQSRAARPCADPPDRPVQVAMSPRRPGPLYFYLGFGLLAALHFYVRPRLWDGRAAPDFLLLALLLVAIRARPGIAALAGFVVGLVTDVLTPASFGAAALAHTVVGYLASWGRAVFFADNLL